MIAEEDFEEESEDEEILNNFVTFVGIVEFDEGHVGSESDDEQDDDDGLVKSYMDVREALIRIGLENTVLAKEKLRLEAMVEALQAELQAEKKLSLESVSLMKEKLILATKADMWEKELYAEKEVTAQLQTQLDLQYKKIHMFAGTKQLDKILSYGRTKKFYSGLRYTGRSASETENTKFVPDGFSHPTEQRNQSTTLRRIGCYFYGKHGISKPSITGSGTRFIRNKSETDDSFRSWALQLLNERGRIKRIRSDHGGEFENGTMKAFCEDHGISHQFYAPWTPQQNGVVERKNRTLQEMARAMIHGSSVAVKYWAEALSTACYIVN
ncbi:hypothetical protein AALP_AA7G194800 [Arabis alpina]|uniref:Integrase catalytic domain-containing protein n=1 Tax=Arabis alpina TaxID=50452 RepID=A0A087GJ62_ARAAL|nr:hypothetical protein AALP_AA7G194800 [Arabis alpina]